MAFRDLHTVHEMFAKLCEPAPVSSSGGHAAYMREHRALNHLLRQVEAVATNARRRRARATKAATKKPDWRRALVQDRVERRTKMKLLLTFVRPVR